MDYNLLEEKLQKTLTDLGRREKQLGEAEQEVPTTRCIVCVAVLLIYRLCPRNSDSYCLCHPDSKTAERAEGQIRSGPPGVEG